MKLRLPSREAHAKVASLLAAGHKATHAQENYFFDGANGELNAQRIVMRVRFYDVDKKALLTVKVSFLPSLVLLQGRKRGLSPPRVAVTGRHGIAVGAAAKTRQCLLPAAPMQRSAAVADGWLSSVTPHPLPE